jgi:thiosulfate dehydrogenase [quinone] large subunit
MGTQTLNMNQNGVLKPTRSNHFANSVFRNAHWSWLWLFLRLFVGWEWISASWAKLHNPAWVGSNAGAALSGFINSALAKTSGAHPNVQLWYGWFLKTFVLPHTIFMSYLVTGGEFLVGAALILGMFTGFAAFFGGFMSMNYMLAGSVSLNPILFVIEILLLFAWRSAGWLGLDRWAIPVYLRLRGGSQQNQE